MGLFSIPSRVLPAEQSSAKLERGWGTRWWWEGGSSKDRCWRTRHRHPRTGGSLQIYTIALEFFPLSLALPPRPPSSLLFLFLAGPTLDGFECISTTMAPRRPGHLGWESRPSLQVCVPGPRIPAQTNVLSAGLMGREA